MMHFRFSWFIVFFAFFNFVLTSSDAQIAANIKVSGLTHDSAAVIAVTWPVVEEAKWHEENDGRLDILGLKANIRAEKLKHGGSKTTTYTFGFAAAAEVELLIGEVKVADGEEVYLLSLVDQQKQYDFSASGKSRSLTTSFDPATTVLVWKANERGTYSSTFVIENIYYQPKSAQRGSGIGFGTALPCHPNAACKTDSMMQLISSSAVRMRLVMEEGIGWCTGSLVNTTRHDKTPYLLTAFHCQYNYTPIYDMWRFDFQFKSSECANPSSAPQFFSLVGCELKSLGQESDYLLVLLNEDIPINQEVTFAGWDRDDMAKPDTSYLIHHPNADIRKFSTCVDEATIHPNQIGWVEGYTTPAFHHFRMKFTEGGHESGSSGGPLFNEEGLLVGQLHGGTKGCEQTNNAYIGRFAKSWNLGTVPSQRLSDWLDPDQTGEMQIPSIRNIASSESINLRGLIRDPKNTPVSNCVVKITGSVEQTITTGDDGVFELKGVNRNGQYTITPEKNGIPTNGLNALDLVAIQKHLLGKDTFNLNWQFLAADATNNGEVSVGDIVLILRLLLGKIQNFPSCPSWKFDPPQVFIDPVNQGDPAEIYLQAIKVGDLNGTADPKK